MNQGGTPLFRFSDRARTRVFEHLIRFNQPDSHFTLFAVVQRLGRLDLGRLARVDQSGLSEVTHFENGIGNRSEIRGLSSTPQACSSGNETSRQYYPRRRRAGWCSIIHAKGA